MTSTNPIVQKAMTSNTVSVAMNATSGDRTAFFAEKAEGLVKHAKKLALKRVGDMISNLKDAAAPRGVLYSDAIMESLQSLGSEFPELKKFHTELDQFYKALFAKVNKAASVLAQ